VESQLITIRLAQQLTLLNLYSFIIKEITRIANTEDIRITMLMWKITGQTTRAIENRIKEYKKDVNYKRKVKSVVAEYFKTKRSQYEFQ